MKSRSTRRRSTPSQAQRSHAPVGVFHIEDTTHEGNGVARDQGKVTFVAGAIAGEEVEARVVKQGRQFNQAIATKWLTQSPQRIAPPCPHFEQCGGCQLQHLTISAQREVKEKWLANQFRHLAFTGTIERLEGTEFAYRRRARLSVFAKQGEVRIGFRAQSSNEIIDIQQCPVLVPALQTLYIELREQIKVSALAGKIGHIELLNDAFGNSVVIRQSRHCEASEKAQWSEWANKHEVAVYWQEPEQERVDAPKRHYEVDGLSVYFHAQDFIQVNAEINLKMVDQAMAWLAPTSADTVLDLFCGAGNFSLPLAQRAGHVIGVEVLDSMVQMGQFNAQQAQLENIEFLAADLTQAPPNRLKKAKISKALLDPPRAGAYECLPTLVKLRPQQILYVSCNAATLARDAAYLVEQGYHVARVCMMDMFPQTSHVETMMLLQY